MLRLFLICVSGCLLVTCAQAPIDKARPNLGFKVFGYYPWWMQERWESIDYALLDKVIFFELAVSDHGGFADTHGWPRRWTPLIRRTGQSGVPIVPTISLFDAEAFTTLFEDPRRRASLRANAMEAVRRADAAGLHLDFEVFVPVSDAARRGFVSFVREVDAALHAYDPDAQLTIFVPAHDPGANFDVRTLVDIADYLVVQGYDLHWQDGPTAGPVAPLEGWAGLDWTAILDRYEGLGVDPKQLIMAVPYYGYEWPTVSDEPGALTRGPGSPIAYVPIDSIAQESVQATVEERTARYGVLRDPLSGSPYYVYEAEDGWYQGWFEDGESLERKYRFVRDHGLGGIALFALGYDGGKLDEVLRRRSLQLSEEQ